MEYLLIDLLTFTITISCIAGFKIFCLGKLERSRFLKRLSVECWYWPDFFRHRLSIHRLLMALSFCYMLFDSWIVLLCIHVYYSMSLYHHYIIYKYWWRINMYKLQTTTFAWPNKNLSSKTKIIQLESDPRDVIKIRARAFPRVQKLVDGKVVSTTPPKNERIRPLFKGTISIGNMYMNQPLIFRGHVSFTGSIGWNWIIV